MQLVPILLIAVVLAADGGLRLFEPPSWLTPAHSTMLTCGPVLLILLACWIAVEWCRIRLIRAGGPRWILRADRFVRLARSLVLINHVASLLVVDWLVTVRQSVGDQILVDELIAILPATIGLVGLWWLHYPIERRVREALLVRQLDLGRTIRPMPPRGRFVLQQVRLHLLLLLVPLLLIIAVSETIHRLVPAPVDPMQPVGLRDTLSLIGGLGVFMLAPLIARVLLAVEPLSPGEVRTDLLEVCRSNRVRVREILHWDTGGTMINAAVMGLVGRLRYVLMTDALLESMKREQILAVMAHEIGHVRRHHMPWLVITLAATLAVTWYIQLPVVLWGEHWPDWLQIPTGVLEVSIALIQLVALLLVFGWVSRRFERQADTFAVQHLSTTLESEHEDPTLSFAVTDEAVNAMTGALGSIAELNAIDRERSSWRHGSIAWRQAYLEAIRGLPLGALVIDRIVRRIKLLSLAVLIIAVGGIIWIESTLAKQPVEPIEWTGSGMPMETTP